MRQAAPSSPAVRRLRTPPPLVASRPAAPGRVSSACACLIRAAIFWSKGLSASPTCIQFESGLLGECIWPPNDQLARLVMVQNVTLAASVSRGKIDGMWINCELEPNLTLPSATCTV